MLFYGLHSGFASQKTKVWIQEKIPVFHSNYRLVYNLFHFFALVGIWSFGVFQEPTFLFQRNLYLLIPGSLLLIWGAFVGFKAFKIFDGTEFLIGKPTQAPPMLIEKGWYAKVRHPLYFALMVILMGAFLIWPSLKLALFIAVTALYLPFGMHWEEQKLSKTFGTDYQTYKRRVPQIIPRLWF